MNRENSTHKAKSRRRPCGFLSFWKIISGQIPFGLCPLIMACLNKRYSCWRMRHASKSFNAGSINGIFRQLFFVLGVLMTISVFGPVELTDCRRFSVWRTVNIFSLISISSQVKARSSPIRRPVTNVRRMNTPY